MTFAILSFSLLFLNRPLLSSLFLGTALSLKYYLGLLLFPLYQSSRYRFLLYTIIFIVIENIISALVLFLYGSSNIKLFSHLFDPAIYSLWTLSHKIAWSSHLLNLFFALIYPIHFVFGEDYARAAVPVIEKVYMYLDISSRSLAWPLAYLKGCVRSHGSPFLCHSIDNSNKPQYRQLCASLPPAFCPLFASDS